MSLKDEVNLHAAKECIAKSIQLLSEKKAGTSSSNIKESNIRHSFTSYLRLIFPQVPWWIEDHITRGEANSAFAIDGKARSGFVDNLVGSTAIEYELDLRDPMKFKEGLNQVRNYCAALVNKGVDPDHVVGVLSDTVRWKAYRISAISGSGHLGGENLSLEEISSIEVTAADDISAKKLTSFLIQFLGRRGSRRLDAGTITNDLGIESTFCASHANSLTAVVTSAFKGDPRYAEMIAGLWCNFVTYLRDRGSKDAFELQGYVDELYILTLAKLICANVLAKKALLSDDIELSTILDGSYFQSRGLVNLVEYDYFGWLNSPPHLHSLLPVARAIQSDLEAYDFNAPIAEDLFGRLMTQLARRTQRLLLGQEWTPSWLASRLVENVVKELPPDADPRFVDMCCGSGAIVVETLIQTQNRLKDEVGSLKSEELLKKLTQSITGFDIDPLAVILSKINWVLTAHEWIDRHFQGLSISIPIYHADSLFAITPLSQSVDEEAGREFYTLKILDYTIELPSFLIAADYQSLFDGVLDRVYALAKATSAHKVFTLKKEDAELAINALCSELGISLSAAHRDELIGFLSKLVEIIDTLHKEGRNGVWIFVIRNSYRPGLAVGNFNGLVSNPPWLALSKIADNPYKDVLRQRAEHFAITPAAQSHLHIELSTIFLLHAISNYLANGAVIGCILPDTIRTGDNHNPFRLGSFRQGKMPVDFKISEIWKVGHGTFKNEACVLFGHKVKVLGTQPSPIPGALVDANSFAEVEFQIRRRGDRVSWADGGQVATSDATLHEPAAFRQGADVMPRTLFFHAISPVNESHTQWRVDPIDVSTSPLAFVIKDAKQHKTFRISPRVVPSRVVFDVLTSNLLTPFVVDRPLKALLPIEKRPSGQWQPISEVSLAATPTAKAAFDEILRPLGNGASIQGLYSLIDSQRKKLTNQVLPQSGYIVFTGAGGSFVCSSYASLDQFDVNKLVIDQTLYWAVVDDESEAIYLTGILNSEAINSVIRDFQPSGAFGERHIHKLAPEATPLFDPSNATHVAACEATKQLIEELQELIDGDESVRALLDPNRSLASRRRAIRGRIKELPSYENYERACRVVLGLQG